MYPHGKKNYRIILIEDNKEIATLSSYASRQSCQKKFHQLIEENKNIICPSKFVNTKGIKEVNYKLALIKRKDTMNEVPTRLRNEYGEFIDQPTNSKDWYIFEIAPYQMEEKFWVYGYHNHRDRKTFQWIYDNMIKPKASDKYTFLNMTLYVNKILLETNTTFDMIICKNKTDSIRLYNLIEKYANDDKLKYIIFSGDGGLNRYKSGKMIDKISAKTGWNRKKCMRPCTRP